MSEKKASLLHGELDVERPEAPRRPGWRTVALRLAQLLGLTGALYACILYGRANQGNGTIDVDKLMRESPLIGKLGFVFINLTCMASG